MTFMRTFGVITVALIIAPPAVAGTFSGTITDSGGGALEGVMIRTTDGVSGMSETIFSNAEGAFRLETALAGTLRVRLRTPYYRDLETKIELAADGAVDRALVMTAMTGDKEISDSLPAAYHFGSLAFETGDDAVFNQFQFQRDCLSCHQLGNAMTRNARDPASWHQTIVRMHRYMGGRFDAKLRRRRSVILSQGFDGEPIMVRPEFPLDPSLAVEDLRVSADQGQSARRHRPPRYRDHLLGRSGAFAFHRDRHGDRQIAIHFAIWPGQCVPRAG